MWARNHQQERRRLLEPQPRGVDQGPDKIHNLVQDNSNPEIQFITEVCCLQHRKRERGVFHTFCFTGETLSITVNPTNQLQNCATMQLFT